MNSWILVLFAFVAGAVTAAEVVPPIASQTPPLTDPAVAIAAAVAAAMAQNSANSQTNVMIINAILTFMGLLVTGAVTVLVTMVNSKVKNTQAEMLETRKTTTDIALSAAETKNATAAIALNSAAQAESTEKIHVAVNSEREATKAEIKVLNDRVLDMAKIIAKFEQVKADSAAAKDKP